MLVDVNNQEKPTKMWTSKRKEKNKHIHFQNRQEKNFAYVSHS